METHAIDLDDEPDNYEDLANNGSMGNGHIPAEPMSEDREPDDNGTDGEEPTSTNAGEGELLS